MLIYKDKISGAELFSDTYPMELCGDGCVFKVKGKQETRMEGSDYDIGGNASAEEVAEEVASGSATSGINICMDNRLEETAFGKKDYMKYIKAYMKQIKEKLDEDKKDEECAMFQKGMAKFMKEMIGQFDDLCFYQSPDDQTAEGMIPLCVWDEATPYMYFFKHGLIEEKV